MKLIIKGKELNKVHTLHITRYSDSETGVSCKSQFVVYDDYDNNGNLITQVMYFDIKDLECFEM